MIDLHSFVRILVLFFYQAKKTVKEIEESKPVTPAPTSLDDGGKYILSYLLSTVKSNLFIQI